MPDTLVCPVCGETNPAEMEFCQNCQSRLHPFTGALKGENSAIQPGEPPTKKVTSELEPILPQWLRDARQKARDTAADDAAKADREEKENPPSAAPDLLAGLASQSKDEEDETPDWVARITGTPAKKKKPVPDEGQVKWVELGHDDGPGDEQASMHPARPASEKDELTDWFKQAAASAETADFVPPSTLAGTAPTSASSESDQPPAKSEQPAEAEDLSWLRSLDAAAAPPVVELSPEPEPRSEEEQLSWLRKLDEAASTVEPSAETKPLPRLDTPDWLQKLQADQAPLEDPAVHVEQPPATEIEVPAWLQGFGQEAPASTEPAAPATEPPVSEGSLPDWLKGMREPAAETSPAAAEPSPEQPIPPSELPDWVSQLGPGHEAAAEEMPPAATAIERQTPPPETPRSEAPVSTGAVFTEDGIPENDVDAIFASMQMPDWLSAVMPSPPPAAETIPPAAQEEQAIGPAELPSWVQAMRPIESAMGASAAGQEDATAEERGPLAGLLGVLPVIPGAAAPSSKPRAYSIKLEATEQQQAHAALLEQILAAETSPTPTRAGAPLKSQKALRWVVALLVFLVVGGVVFAGTASLPLPGAVPNETVGAVDAIEAVPPDAAVLVVFDYQPSTVGEMEAAGASLLDHLLLLKHPRLALLSTSPTGAALAERFMSTTLAARSYTRGLQYVDLGYLPGGLTGVYNFAQNPAVAVPLGADSQPVWQSAILSTITHFSDFAAIIVLTDSVDAGRTWIEQTTAARGTSSMVIISSAQAGPVLLSYVDSGQVKGLVSGLNGAAGAEQANGGLPGLVRQYWDAYSLGLYLAVALIMAGGLWNFWLGTRDRRAQGMG